MRTLQIELPEDIEHQLRLMDEDQQAFILKAIREKMKKSEILKNKLIEGYKSTYEEDLEITEDFEFSDLENWQ